VDESNVGGESDMSQGRVLFRNSKQPKTRRVPYCVDTITMQSMPTLDRIYE
jgi:hypothetical protein